MRPFPTWLALPAVLVLLGFLLPCQRYLEGKKHEFAAETLLYLPRGTLIRHLACGYEGLIADYYWLKSISYVNYEMDRIGKRRYLHLADLFDLITDLDPWFVGGYVWGAMFLSSLSREPDTAIRLLEKGLRQMPNEWFLTMHLALVYYVDKGDLVRGGEIMERASKMPNAPPELAKVAAVIKKGAEWRVEFTLNKLAEYESAREPVRKRVIRNRILSALRHANTRLLKRVYEEYALRHEGRRPALLDELQEKKYLVIDSRTAKLLVNFHAEERPDSKPR